MSSQFTPLSSQLGVAGTSYRIQLGKIGENWAARILKGNDIVASQAFDKDLNGNLVVGFVMRETAIPNLNPYQIMKTVQFLTREAQNNEQRMKEQGGIPAPTTDQPAAALQPTPGKTPIAQDELSSDEDKRASYRVVARPQSEQPTPTPVAQSAIPVSGSKPATIPAKRSLKEIPSAAGEVAAASSPATTTTPEKATPAPTPVSKQPVSSGGSDLDAIIKRLEKIESSLARIESTLIKIEEELFK